MLHQDDISHAVLHQDDISHAVISAHFYTYLGGMFLVYIAMYSI
jgi:hypothetical protein